MGGYFKTICNWRPQEVPKQIEQSFNTSNILGKQGLCVSLNFRHNFFVKLRTFRKCLHALICLIDDNSTRPNIHFDRDYKCLNYRGTTDKELDVASLLRPTKSMSAWLYGPGEDTSGLTCFTRDWVKHSNWSFLSFFCLNFSPSLMWDFLHPGWLHWGLWKQLWILSKVPGRFYSIMIVSANIPYLNI